MYPRAFEQLHLLDWCYAATSPTSHLESLMSLRISRGFPDDRDAELWMLSAFFPTMISRPLPIILRSFPVRSHGHRTAALGQHALLGSSRHFNTPCNGVPHRRPFLL
ncbi:hypothetical protein CY34DRAFT_187836 [Suillus luteus UH-Slu-Lm8-n1]|uniref:Uncharacterized protein n=1 Tax=Suillus luteus UH-Slu-Lm8-n1 TaxID=930992 RepID=A0A0D0BEF1_9AGAM|nr:hypothetical protein CY34DRAFT_187836 [Suillus luteus UH-Slu-Lm8-n1]